MLPENIRNAEVSLYFHGALARIWLIYSSALERYKLLAYNPLVSGVH